MPLNADILNRLAALKLPSKAYQQVLSIIADVQSALDEEASEAKRKDQERRYRNAERMRTVRAQKPHSADTVHSTNDAQTTHCAPLVSPTPPSFLPYLPIDKHKDSLSLEEPLSSTEGILKLQQGRSENVALARAREAAPPDDWPKDFREQFWQVYPRRVGKKAAIAKLERIRKSGEITWRALIGNVQAIEVEDIRYVPHPLTWLNRGSYLDGEASTGQTPDWITQETERIRRERDEAKAVRNGNGSTQNGEAHQTHTGTVGGSGHEGQFFSSGPAFHR